MSTSTHLGLPYLAAAQAQKHVTHNEALRVLDAVVQMAVLTANLTAPPVRRRTGDRHIVASGATGAWAGWDLNIAYYVDGAWMRLVPRVGWQAYVAAEGGSRSGTGPHGSRPSVLSSTRSSVWRMRRSDPQSHLFSFWYFGRGGPEPSPFRTPRASLRSLRGRRHSRRKDLFRRVRRLEHHWDARQFDGDLDL